MIISPNEIIQNNVLCEYLRKDFDNLYFLNFLNDCHFCGEMLMNGFQIMQEEAGRKVKNGYAFPHSHLCSNSIRVANAFSSPLCGRTHH